MRVLLLDGGKQDHPLTVPLQECLRALRPTPEFIAMVRPAAVKSAVDMQMCLHTFTQTRVFFDHVIYLPPLPDEWQPIPGFAGDTNRVCRFAAMNNAALLVLSRPEALEGNLNHQLSVHLSHYGQALKAMEAQVAGYPKGYVVRAALCELDPWVRGWQQRAGSQALKSDESDCIFNLVYAQEIGEQCCKLLASGWYGLHQIGPKDDPLTLSHLLGDKVRRRKIWNYVIRPTGTLGQIKTPSLEVWKCSKAVSKGY